MKKTKCVYPLIVLCAFLFTACGESVQTDYVVLVGEDAGIVDRISDTDILVVDGDYFTSEDVTQLKDNGVKKVYTYFNIGSLESYRDYYEAYAQYALGDYENWPEEQWADISSNEWQSLLRDRAEAMMQKGFDGFFVDNTDVYYVYPYEEIYDGIVDVLQALYGLDKDVIINGGDCFVKRYLESEENPIQIFDGVNQENVYTGYDFEKENFEINSDEARTYYEEYLDFVMQKGYKVFTVEYAKDKQTKKSAYSYAKKHKYRCYVSDNIELKMNK